TEYGKRNRKTMDQLLVNSTLADYYRTIGETERAVDYYAQALELSKNRANELKQVQLNIHKILKNADSSISKLNKKVIETEDRANKDPMTKLLNRSAMLKVSEEFIEKAAKNKEKIGAIFIDVDYFKECNDIYGHAKGDEIIKEVAHACQKEESEQVRFARYGGDEFLGLTCGLEDGAVTEIARRICSRIRKADIPNRKNPNGHRVTLSVGIVNVKVTKKTDTIIQIANYADKAVYYSKNAGKDCIHLLDYECRNAKSKDDPFVKIEF
nr:diguanylate cyclase [Lachnospiraceae bacterium]